MSLILDALRKSEAERRRGQAPDLFAPVAATTAVRGKQPVAMIGVALAALAAAAIVVFWPTQPSHSPVPGNADELTPQPAPPIATPAVVPAAVAPIASAPRLPARPPVETNGKPIAVKPGAGPPPAIAVATAPPPIESASATPSETASAEPTPDTAEPDLPTLATLDSAARAALPPLQLSMHVWNPDASRRFAIIDGQRLGEGGKLAGAVVAQIRRDGVVLEIDGRQYLLPRP